jgi:hypothetical protein
MKLFILSIIGSVFQFFVRGKIVIAFGKSVKANSYSINNAHLSKILN